MTATHNVDIAPMATSCVSIVDGLKTLKTAEWVIDTGQVNAFNLTGIDSVNGGVAIVVDTYGCGSEPLCREPDLFPRDRRVTGATLRMITGAVTLRRKSGMSWFTNPLNVLFPLLDYESQTRIISHGPAGRLFAKFGHSEIFLGPEVKNSQPVGFGANAARFHLSDMNLQDPYGLEKFNLVSNCRGSASIDITNNTGLEMVLLPGLDSAKGVIITANVDHHTAELLIGTATYILVEENGRKLNLTLLRQGSVGCGTFTDLSLISLPRLKKTNSSSNDLVFANNTILALQLPRLGSVNNSFIINNNTALFDIGVPRLQTVHSDLILHDNPRLFNFTANILKTASSISLIGLFTNVEFFSLELVSGNFEVIGDPTMDCSWFDAHLRDKVVKGSYTCVGNHTYTPRRPSTSTELPPDDLTGPGGPGSDEGGGLNTAAKPGVGIGATVGALVLIGLGLWPFLRWRRKKGDGARGILP